MRIRWTELAADDLYAISRYIQRDKPRAARQVVKAIYDGCNNLVRNPLLGRKGKVTGTRELVFTPLPYLAVYRICEDAVEILRIWHGAQER
jgi:addiction module RelE/StbE family toxin